MALDIKESFEVGAPIDAVWAFLNDPQNVVACMPGASLNEIVDDKQFIGSVKLKIGAVSAPLLSKVSAEVVAEAASPSTMVCTSQLLVPVLT